MGATTTVSHKVKQAQCSNSLEGKRNIKTVKSGVEEDDSRLATSEEGGWSGCSASANA